MLACCPLSSRVCQRESERERSRLCEGTCLLERKKKLLFCSLRHRQTCFCNTGTSIQPNKDLSYRQSFNSLKELILLFSSSGYLFFWNTISKKSFSFTLYLSFSPFATHWCLVCQFHYRARWLLSLSKFPGPCNQPSLQPWIPLTWRTESPASQPDPIPPSLSEFFEFGFRFQDSAGLC